MRNKITASLKLLTLLSMSLVAIDGFNVANAQELARTKYEPHPDTVRHEGVPTGEIVGPFEWKSKIYPGTIRNYHLYIPAQYKTRPAGAKPACVFVVQDGLGHANGWKLHETMDNLIADGSMPITIGIFVEHGRVPVDSPDAQPRFNRSFEYDSMGDRYARFLIEEILPEVAKSYDISSDPNDRAIGGASSGAICAFNVAWERPDQFRRVLSTIGTYVGLRGADEFSTLVRKTEPKPIRVYLQDGSNDLNIYAGDWWNANQGMERALKYAGYEVEHVWGDGGHDGVQAKAIVPDALRWLWKDYPQPVATPFHENGRVKVLQKDEPWKLVSDGHQFTDGPAVDADGNVYFGDVQADKIFRIDLDGSVKEFASQCGGPSGLMFGADGSLYVCANKSKQIVKYDTSAKRSVLLDNATCNDLVVMQHGIYYTDPTNKAVWLLGFDGKKTQVSDMIEFPNGIIATPDQKFLLVSDYNGQFVYSFAIQGDRTLTAGQEYGYLHLPYGSGKSQGDGMTCDKDGNIYVTTALGIQVMDQLGRVNLIISKPQAAFMPNIVFGGKDLQTLYATNGDKVYARQTNAVGVRSWQSPVKPPKPGL
jgi:sugar lactone lactonase YvrE/enterochelin esterase-like enzyme